METIDTQATRYLTAHHIPHRVFVHQNTVHSLQQAAEERAQQPAQIIRSLLFRLSDGVFVMVLASGPEQIPWKRLRTLLQTSRVTMATDEEVLQITGCRPGTVTPFGLPAALKILIDRRIVQHEEISLGACRSNTAIILKTSDLLQALNGYTLVDLFADS